MQSTLTVTPAVVEVEFPYKEVSGSGKTSPYRPLHDAPDIMLQDVYGGLTAMTDKRLYYGTFVNDGCCCAVGAGLLNSHAKKTGATVDSLIRTYQGIKDGFAVWERANWNSLSGRVNDKFGKPFTEDHAASYANANHPSVQKARYFFVLGVVSSELALRGLL